MHSSSIRSALASAFQIRPSPNAVQRTLPAAANLTSPNPRSSHPTSNTSAAPFSTTSCFSAKKSKSEKTDRRITLIRYFLHHPTTLTPRPLRFSRNRALRHWTIARAWKIFRAKQRHAHELQLQRQYQAMEAANEELRVGAGDGGRLFRMAQMKTGIWSIPERGGGVPIEYARGLVEWVGTTKAKGAGEGDAEAIGGAGRMKAKIWDSAWKRF